MLLQELRIQDLRNLSRIDIHPDEGLNIISGPNASGKTALLEAIYLLARSRSFRTHRLRELIRRGSERLQVTARGQTPGGRQVAMGIERDRSQTRLRYDAETVRNLSAHARSVPLVLITPDSHSLISGRPGQRRRWLDWAMFHVEPDYLRCWQDSFHALRQRNALLKHSAGESQLATWEHSMAASVAQLDAYRDGFIERLAAYFAEVMAVLLPGEARVEYYPGRPRESEYASLLAASRDQERQRGFTLYGPHRSDLLLQHEGVDARANLSRGQAKLFIAGIMTAYARLLTAAGLWPLLLVDDLPAELDAGARERFMAELARCRCQSFVTAIDPETLPDRDWASSRVFHVEQGQLQEMLQ